MLEFPAEVIDYGAFERPPSSLFIDYLAGEARIRSFYEDAGWNLDAVMESSRRTLVLPRQREELARILCRQQRERGAAEAASRASQLAHPESVAIVTGQQAGLLGGPLYVLYKALTTLKVAQAMGRGRSAPVVPVFWIASDDHDFEEIRSVSLLDARAEVKTLRYAPDAEPSGEPASAIELDRNIETLIEELGRILPPGPHRETAIEAVAAAYTPGSTLPQAFGRLLAALLPDLVILDASDPELRPLMASVIRRELMEDSPTSRLALGTGAALVKAGYHEQVPVRAGFLNLFLVADGRRRALAFREGQLEVRGLARRMPLAEAERLLETDPAVWSPGALLRPLAQDALLPTAAYVGGPAEIAYHAQVGAAYAHFGIPRPTLLPRPSLTLVEPAQARALSAEGLSLVDLQQDPETLLARWAREAHPQVEARFEAARQAIDRELAAIEEVLTKLEPTLRAPAHSTRGRAQHQLEALHAKSWRVLKKRDQARLDRLHRTRNALLPGGVLQERQLGLIGLVARHGPAAIDALRAGMDPWAQGHQILRL